MSKKKARWRKLDNAAKLYSAASNKKDTRVFRFYCELKEEVNPDVLQEALNQTIEIFPTFLMVLRKGLFWHYLEPCNFRTLAITNIAVSVDTLMIGSTRSTDQLCQPVSASHIKQIIVPTKSCHIAFFSRL